jgi:uncharacterized protein YuzE
MATKMKTSKHYSINYDENADVLYISFGKPKPGIGVEVEEGDIVRVDPFTHRIVGVTIIDFRAKHGSDDLDKKTDSILPEILDKYAKQS